MWLALGLNSDFLAHRHTKSFSCCSKQLFGSISKDKKNGINRTFCRMLQSWSVWSFDTFFRPNDILANWKKKSILDSIVVQDIRSTNHMIFQNLNSNVVRYANSTDMHFFAEVDREKKLKQNYIYSGHYVLLSHLGSDSALIVHRLCLRSSVKPFVSR